jgi:vanillate O-demethylase monooxygenase subunit
MTAARFLLDAWHKAGWSSGLTGGAFVHRTLSDIEVLVYRLQNGAPAAIRDRCAHRFVPLHLGKQVGDAIQCGYHGLCFGADGSCVKHPVAGATIPKTARVQAFPVVERDGILWVWLGDATRADPATIPDYGFLSAPGRAVVAGAMRTLCDYRLAIDNLTDLTHIQFVHSAYQASEAFPNIESRAVQDATTITSHLLFPNGRPPPFFARLVADPEQPIDLAYEVRWTPPSNAKLTVRGFKPGERSTPLFEVNSAHIVAAETPTTCHYFFANSRDFAVGDAAVDEQVREWQRVGFAEQDKPMLEAQQRMIGDADIMSLGPALMATDAGPVRIRRVLESLIHAQQGAAAAAPPDPARVAVESTH